MLTADCIGVLPKHARWRGFEMEKAQLPVFEELSLGHTSDSTPKSPTNKFSGTANPRHLRVINALITRSRKREEIDAIAGCSNAPELIAELRRRGLDVPCARIPGVDRDGKPIRFGVYDFTRADRRKIKRWLRKRGGA